MLPQWTNFTLLLRLDPCKVVSKSKGGLIMAAFPPPKPNPTHTKEWKRKLKIENYTYLEVSVLLIYPVVTDDHECCSKRAIIKMGIKSNHICFCTSWLK